MQSDRETQAQLINSRHRVGESTERLTIRLAMTISTCPARAARYQVGMALIVTLPTPVTGSMSF